MSKFAFAATLTPDEADGGFTVTFRDLPEAITQGDTKEQCLIEAADCLEEALAARIDDNLDIPPSSEAEEGEFMIHVPIVTALKAALYLAVREAGITKVQLAKTLNTDEKEVRRILDPHHGTKIPTIERALHALGKHAELHVF
jgi:antitoxin HicB